MDLATLAAYRRIGGALFPTRAGQPGDKSRKEPLFAGWQNADIPDTTLLQYAQLGHGIGWAIPQGVVILDVDLPSPNRPGKVGHESLQKLFQVVGQLAPYGVVADSGSCHFYLNTNGDDAWTSNKEFRDIDVRRHGSYVLIANSPHWEGGYYRPSAMMSQYGLDRSVMPQPSAALRQIFLTKAVSRAASPEAMPIDKVQALLELIDTQDFGSNDEWLPLAMAVHSATGGSEQGLAAFMRWCELDPRYRNDGSIVTRWRSMRPDGGITSATLMRIVRQSVMSKPDSVVRFNSIVGLSEAAAEALFSELPQPTVTVQQPQAIPHHQIRLETPSQLQAPQRTERPIVMVSGNNEEQHLGETLGFVPSMCRRTGFYSRHGELVRITTEISRSNTVRTTITPVAEAVLRATLTGEIDFAKNVQQKDGSWSVVPVTIPHNLVKAVHAFGRWPGAPRLNKVVTGPCMIDKEVAITTPGYYEPYGLFYAGPNLNVPIYQPSLPGSQWSANNLLDLVCDFPFAAPSHRSAWLAFLLTLVARPAIQGPVPLSLVISNEKGSGKTLLCKIATSLATGDFETAPMSAADEAEFEKRMVSMLLAGTSVIVMDNEANGSDIGSPWLDQFLTSSQITSRILGASKSVTFENSVTLAMTGNQLRVAADSDLIRRILVVALNKPEGQLPSFKHGNADQLAATVNARRGSLLGDALNIFAGYVAAGRPTLARPMSSFEEWDRMVRQPILWLGLPDPLDGVKDSPTSLDEQSYVRSLVVEGVSQMLEKHFPDKTATGQELVAKFEELRTGQQYGGSVDPIVQIWEGFITACNKQVRTFSSVQLGLILRSHSGSWAGHRRLVSVRRSGGVNRWAYEDSPTARQV